MLPRGERVDYFETVRRRKEGVPLDVSLTISPVKGSPGSAIGASKIVRDITPLKRAEFALRASEERLRLAQQAAKIGGFEWIFKLMSTHGPANWRNCTASITAGSA